ncbi:hypothetical protein JQK62_19025, partial [Leptospira santarosai]|nr:hypothetical protein [Leptospira santarosai]
QEAVTRRKDIGRPLSLQREQHELKAPQKMNRANGSLHDSFATKLAKRCNVLSCFEASRAMQKQEHCLLSRVTAGSTGFLVMRRMKPCPRNTSAAMEINIFLQRIVFKSMH